MEILHMISYNQNDAQPKSYNSQTLDIQANHDMMYISRMTMLTILQVQI